MIKHTSRNTSAGPEWGRDIQLAFSRLGLLATQKQVCATVAVIEQESTFKTQPDIPGLSRMVQQQLLSPDTNLAMRLAIKARLAQKARNGRRFDANLAQIKTELDLEQWYEEFTAAQLTAPLLRWMDKDVDSLIATLGPMQVSVRFAKEFSKRKQWPTDNLRPYLHTREGGVLYGTAHLLATPSTYSRMIYRFADFNAGPFASRNAAFQQMVAHLAGKRLAFDGDLLSYRKGVPQASSTSEAMTLVLAKATPALSATQVLADLRLEKEADFIRTASYRAISQLHFAQFKSVLQESMPAIELKSVKISRRLTTEWFAQKVQAHYAKCVNAKV